MTNKKENNMKNITIKSLLLLTIIFACGACNKEWEDEQYQRYVSFKAPMDVAVGTTNVYIRYNPNGKVTYNLPLIVSGSTTNDQNMDVHVALDLDTLNKINNSVFNIREDLYYKSLKEEQYTFPSIVNIPSGHDVVTMDIDFTLGNIDLVEKWVLPLTIVDDPKGNYTVHPRKNYKKAILRIIPFNDYSGTYSATAMLVNFRDASLGDMTIDKRSAYVVDDETIFFYAGVQDEDLFDKSKYKIKVRFNEDGTLTLSADDQNINFRTTGDATYKVQEVEDPVLPYLLNYQVILNMSYEFDDYTSVPGEVIGYKANGTMVLERKINTQIPDEDQAIEW